MSSKQSKKQHNFFSLSCKLVEDASLFFISASYLQNKKHVCHLIHLQIVQLGNAMMCPLSTVTEPFAQSHFILLDCCRFQSTIEPFVVDNDFCQVLRFFVANPIRRCEPEKSVYFSIIFLADDLFELLGLEIHVGSL